MQTKATESCSGFTIMSASKLVHTCCVQPFKISQYLSTEALVVRYPKTEWKAQIKEIFEDFEF